MAHVYIPPMLRSMTGGAEVVEVEGQSVRGVIDSLEDAFPGIRQNLCDADSLRPGLSVVVDGTVAPLGLLQRVEEESEVHFLPAIGGGSDRQSQRLPAG